MATVATVTTGSPTPSWSLLLGDGQGSAQVAMELKAVASGTGLAAASATHAVTRNAYLPFGATRGGDQLATSRGWLGQVADTDTGLIYLNARYYDPMLARFISPDPLMNPGDPKTLDPYRYADNNPVVFSDPSGLFKVLGGGPQFTERVQEGAKGNSSIGAGAKSPGGNKKSTGADAMEETLGKLFDAGVVLIGPDGNACGGMDCANPYLNYDFCDLEAGSNGANCWYAPPVLPDCGCRATAGHLLLDLLSLIPVYGAVADIINTIWYAAEGDWVNASASLAGAAPLIGDTVVGARLFAKLTNLASTSAQAISALGKFPACSFSGDTDVLMADGSTKAIDSIRVGDRVMAEDPESGERGPRVVTHVWRHGDQLVDFRVADDVVTTTEDHPFWNATDGEWQGPQEFDAGDRVLTADGNLLVTRGLAADSWHTGGAYNLTVDDIHTFYVVVAGEAVLVHNTCWNVIDTALRQLPTGTSNSSRVRMVTDETALKEFWETNVAPTAVPVGTQIGPKGPVDVYRLPDNTIATWRYDSQSGGPAITFKPPEGGKTWTVHVTNVG